MSRESEGEGCTQSLVHLASAFKLDFLPVLISSLWRIRWHGQLHGVLWGLGTEGAGRLVESLRRPWLENPCWDVGGTPKGVLTDSTVHTQSTLELSGLD